MESNLVTFFGSFLKKEEEGFKGISTTSKPSFLIPQIGEIWKKSRTNKLLTK